jgi:hypothetical protein
MWRSIGSSYSSLARVTLELPLHTMFAPCLKLLNSDHSLTVYSQECKALVCSSHHICARSVFGELRLHALRTFWYRPKRDRDYWRAPYIGGQFCYTLAPFYCSSLIPNDELGSSSSLLCGHATFSEWHDELKIACMSFGSLIFRRCTPMRWLKFDRHQI